MKRYYQTPQMKVITIQNPVILAGSDPTGANLYDSGFNANSEALGRRGYFGEEDEEYE